MSKRKHLIFAGTFDHLHIGHKKMLEKAFELAERVAIGITSDEMVRGKAFGESIEKMEDRRLKVEAYLKENSLIERAEIFILHDIYGPAIEENTFDAILVTETTKKNAEKINTVRVMRGLRKLRVAVEPMVMAEDRKPVTSERIRAGEINREGKQYQISNIKGQKYLKLPEYLREELRKPLGTIIKSKIPNPKKQINSNFQIPNEKILRETARKVLKSIKSVKSIKQALVISVGDIVTISLLMIDFEPDIKVIDFRSRRSDIGKISNIKNQIAKIQIKYQKDEKKVINEPGTININAGRTIRNSTKNVIRDKNKQLIVVKGEEDLLALPAILFAPLGSIVLYGQIDVGIVMVTVTEEKKKQVKEIVEKFR